MSEDTVTYEVDGHVATIALNRPQMHNALSDAMFDQVVEGVRQAADDDDVKCVVLKGNGKSFSSGFDLSDPDDFYGGAEHLGARFANRKLKLRAEVMRDILYSGKPTIARVQSNCIGAGLYLVLVCNFAIASDDAIFGLPEERFGSAGTTWLYPFVAAQCGLKKANELVMTGRKFDALEAERLNLINKVVPRDELDTEVAELARAICSVPREGIASSRAVAHMSYDLLGYPGMFTFHYGMHPHAVMMERAEDEFDFRKRIAEVGLKRALVERDEFYAGRYWGW
ncbi:MAG: enoyl-CoA hydratase/isomerase family protein [Deltaproteobacteria bacterium]|jgi:enoyl-CoA hydratase|nr:enoyl-CoA hydratase/isomerase family protein [Deltaproteobacteria bacterium]MBW2498830.1 enoyl-CoA hydratase/isomerase family protein [Deltaproteobacteria bacterium]